MVKHERVRSRSPVSRDHQRRGRDGSPSDRTRRHHSNRDRHSTRADDSHSKSPSPDTHRHKKHSHRHKEKHRNERREETGNQRDDRTRFDPRREETGNQRDDRTRFDPRREETGNQRDDRTRFDPHRRIKQEPTDSFQEQQQERRRNDDRRREIRQQREQENEDTNFGQPSASEATASSDKEKEKPNFELSGKLTEDTNMYRGVVVKYNEPIEARKPKRRWRLYGFKGEESLPMLPIHRQSAYLLGRDRRVADIPVDHPSCSKQHAVLQYRLTEYTRPNGSVGRRVCPYIIDLGSANGTYVNNQRIDAQRYVELFERDVVKFGFSTREYVLLHENVDTSEVAQESDVE